MVCCMFILCVCVCVMHPSMWRTKINLRYHSSAGAIHLGFLFFEAGSLIDLEPGILVRWVSPRDSPLSTSPELRLQV